MIVTLNILSYVIRDNVYFDDSYITLKVEFDDIYIEFSVLLSGSSY